MKRVALVKMPWGIVDTGSISLGILKSVLNEEKISTDVYYLNLLMASELKKEMYEYCSGNTIVGEIAFSQHLFGKYGTKKIDNSFSKIFSTLYSQSNNKEAKLAALGIKLKENELNKLANDVIPKFIDECMNNIPWNEYSAVGFTCTVGEHLAVLMLSKKIREKFPNIKIIIGGPNVFGTMGQETLRSFNWIDYIVNGEGEEVFPKLIHNIFEKNYYENISGVSFRRGSEIIISKELPEYVCLDNIPIPDYSDYYEQLEKYNLHQVYGDSILFESSRGCWWGEKSPCTFCSSNTFMDKYRVKSSQILIKELMIQAKRYDIRNFYATDTALNMKYFDDFIPELIKKNLGINLYYQVRVNFSREQLIMLKKAGVTKVRAGIESLNTNLLKLMNKGVTAIQNIQFLKLCIEVGIMVDWNLLFKIPGENSIDYSEMINTISCVQHLIPPKIVNKIELQRYSPYFLNPEIYGIKNVHCEQKNEFIYPVQNTSIEDIIYTFSFSCDSIDNIEKDYTDELMKCIDKWKKAFYKNNVYCKLIQNGDYIDIYDNRNLNGCEYKYQYYGLEANIYMFCNEIKSLNQIYQYINSISSISVTSDEVKGILDRFIDNRLMLAENNKYISLAVCTG